MTRSVAASLVVVCCLATPRAVGQANCTVTVTKVTVNGNNQAITVEGTISGVAAGWTPGLNGARAIHQDPNIRVMKSSSTDTLTLPRNGIYNFTYDFTEIPTGTYKILVSVHLTHAVNPPQDVCAAPQDATITSTAPPFVAHGSVTLDAARVANPNTTVRCSGTANANAGWNITDNQVSVWAFPSAAASWCPGAAGLTTSGTFGGTSILTDFPRPRTPAMFTPPWS